jgi:peroxiredoxin family protein
MSEVITRLRASASASVSASAEPAKTSAPRAAKRLSIVCFSGDFDHAVAVFTLASGAAAVNYEVNLFFTFWGLNLMKNRKGRRFSGRGLPARAFNWLQGGLANVPMSRLNFGGFSPWLMRRLMRRRNVATLEELIDASKALGVGFYACEMSMNILGITKKDFVPEVREVIGVARFLELAQGGETLFI